LRELLEKYYDGSSSTDEEKLLRDHFCNGDVPEGYEAEKEIFSTWASYPDAEPAEGFELRIMSAIDRVEIVEPRKHAKLRIMAVSSIAAGLLIIFASYFLLKQKAQPADTFTDPRIAYAETMKILNEVSVKLNRGTAQLQTMNVIEKGARSAVTTVGRSTSAMKKSLSPIGMVKMLEKQQEK